MKSVAVVVIHGVAPHPRYEFQDQCAGDLCDHLNQAQQPRSDQRWVVDVVNPVGSLPRGADEPQPTISRVHRTGDVAGNPSQDYFDVIEGYWSPIDKGKTNWLSVVTWLLRTVFVPLNTTAKYHASWQKQIFDYGYIGGALIAAFALFFLSLTALWQSFNWLLSLTGLGDQTTASSVVHTLNANALAPFGVPVKIIVWLFVGIVGAFLAAQALSALMKLFVQRGALRRDPGAIAHRVIPIAVLVLLGAALIYAMAVVHFPHGEMGWRGITLLVLIFVAFQLGHALLIDFLVGFFGDVQVYTTHDENSSFFDLRNRILDVTVDAMLRAVSPDANGGRRYDRVVILGHSLGATVAMDGIIRLYQLYEQGALPAEDFNRISAFITLGASLEKTKYFFDVASPSPSLSYEQWRSDIYGALFTCDLACLTHPAMQGIFWANYWYFQDPICNEIRSYRSYLKPGDALSDASTLRAQRQADEESDDGSNLRVICRNERGLKSITLTHPMLHSDYLEDAWFWFTQRDGQGNLEHLGALDIITGPIAEGTT